jgi:hypothetical protein
VLEAAIAQAGRFQGLEHHFSGQILEAAHRQYRSRISLQEFLLAAARIGGYTGTGSVRSDLPGILRAAFSNLSIPGILSNNANKFLLQGYKAVDQAWSIISSRRNVSDFKTHTSYRMTGSFQFEKVAPDGELRHEIATEQTFTNKADTYGKIFTVTRTDIINDDLGALTDVPVRIGRGAALKLNDVFWTEFLNNSSFFVAGNNNVITGGSSVLASQGLKLGVEKFRKQTDADGKPLGIMPRFLLVPPELEVAADELYTSTHVNTGGSATTAQVPNANVHVNKYQPVCSPYLSNTVYTGSSATAWYLLADPMDLAVVEVAFLNGVDTPTVESADADFNVLGWQMRGYWDFGVAKQDHRAGVRSAGA